MRAEADAASHRSHALATIQEAIRDDPVSLIELAQAEALLAISIELGRIADALDKASISSGFDE